MRRAGVATPLLTALALGALAAACSVASTPPPTPTAVAAAPSLEPSPSVETTWPPLPQGWWPATFAPTPAATPTPSPSPVAGSGTSGHTRHMTSGVVVGDHIFPVQGCVMTYSHYHRYYQATDIYVAKGCKFVAVTNGVVDEVSYTDTWDPKINSGANRGGIYISIIGDDGVRYYGSHMSGIMPGIAPGVRVTVGQQIAITGQTGDARRSTPHVHFGISWPTRAGIWWVRRGMLYPWPYLDPWDAGRAAYPAGAVAALHAKMGDEPACTAAC
jgi:murein DD-endopeptidase MepM/ murein hydrolase activator NlpD